MLSADAIDIPSDDTTSILTKIKTTNLQIIRNKEVVILDCNKYNIILYRQTPKPTIPVQNIIT